MHRSIAAKLAVSIGVAALALGMLFSFFYVAGAYSEDVAEAQDRALQYLQQSASATSEAVFQLDAVLAEEILADLLLARIFLDIRVIDDIGQQFAYAAQDTGNVDLPYMFFRPEPVLVSIDLTGQDGRAMGFLEAYIDQRFIVSELARDYLIAVGFIIAESLMIAITLFFVVMRTVAGPLVKLSQSLESVIPGSEQKLTELDGHKEDEFGRLIQVINTFLEITASSRKEIESNQKKIEDILNGLRECIVVTSIQGEILNVNKAASEFLGIGSFELIGQYFAEYFPQSSWEQVERIVHQESADANEVIECKINAPARDSKEALIALSSIRIDFESELANLWVFTDITAIKQAEAERNKLESQLRQSQKMEVLGTLASGIAHDFNNVLGAVSGYAELATVESDEAKRQSYLDQVTNASQSAKQLIKGILSFGRHREEFWENCRITQIIQDSLALVRRTIPPSITIEFNCNDQEVVINADPTLIQQVFINLITNSAAAIGNEPGSINISVQQVESGEGHANEQESASGFVEIVVVDSGPGIPAEIVDRIFDPFFTTKAEGKGTGLGLSLVKSIIESSGGWVELQSSSVGTEFKIYLPAVNSPGLVEGKSENVALFRGDAERILLAEDNEVLANLYQEILTRAGYSVDLCVDGADAWEIYKTSPDQFDLVISDQSMPNLDGSNLLKKIWEKNENQAVILMTGNTSSISVTSPPIPQLFRLIQKPFSTESLQRSIQEILKAI